MKTLVAFLVMSVFSEAFLTTFRKDVNLSTPSPAKEQKALFNNASPYLTVPEPDHSPLRQETPINTGVGEVDRAPAAVSANLKALPAPESVSNLLSEPASSSNPKPAMTETDARDGETIRETKMDDPAATDNLKDEVNVTPTIVTAAPVAAAETEIRPHSIYSHALMTENSTSSVVYTRAPETVEHSTSAMEMKKRAGYNLYYAASRKIEKGADSYSYMLLYQKAEQLKAYAKAHHYSTRYGFILNMGMKSGKKRFFIIDLATMTIIKNGVVAHGRGDSRFTLEKRYSNEEGSNCTSLGIYKVGRSYRGIFGKAYKLYGLENSNSNAYKRAIVLHSMHNIPEEEIDFPIFQTEGCPSVSPEFLDNLGSIINHSSKPVLMWIFDPASENEPLYSMN